MPMGGLEEVGLFLFGCSLLFWMASLNAGLSLVTVVIESSLDVRLDCVVRVQFGSQ